MGLLMNMARVQAGKSLEVAAGIAAAFDPAAALKLTQGSAASIRERMRTDIAAWRADTLNRLGGR